MKSLNSIVKSLATIAESMVKIHLDLKSLNHNIEEGNLANVITLNGKSLACNLDSIQTCISNVPTFTQAEDIIKKQIKFDKEYTKRKEENPALVQIIETFIKPSSEYEIIDLYDSLAAQYNIENKKEKKDKN